LTAPIARRIRQLKHAARVLTPSPLNLFANHRLKSCLQRLCYFSRNLYVIYRQIYGLATQITAC
jgi:hypothetical protein